MATVTRIIVTCDYPTRSGKTCGLGAPFVARAQLDTDSFDIELCPKHHQNVKAALAKLGFMIGSNVNGKPRKGYVAKSGLVFTAHDARPWLQGQGIAGAAGRINTEQIQMYAEAH